MPIINIEIDVTARQIRAVCGQLGIDPQQPDARDLVETWAQDNLEGRILDMERDQALRRIRRLEQNGDITLTHLDDFGDEHEPGVGP